MQITERNFDTNVQMLKYKVLKGVVEHFDQGTLESAYRDIPMDIAPGPKPTTRCCVYKERAIITERVRMAMGGDKENANVIEVLRIACDECTVNRYHVGSACRGCIAHRCEHACPTGAIEVRDGKARINQEKCIECGKCATACPYTAIMKYTRPCENACKIGAISMHRDNSAKIDNDKCISCGACVYQCPFGAIVDKSFILDVVDMIKKSDHNENYKLYAVVAPSISSQFSYAKLGQVITGIQELGFFHVVEAALGADMVSYAEAAELAEKGFLTSSCCPAFVDYIEKQFPQLKEHVSHNLSPAATIAKYIKETTPGAKVVFIGPCTAKKMEVQKERVKPYIDSCITFEELQALFDSRDIDLKSLPEGVLDNASYYGRIFARSGGLSDAVTQALKEQGLDQTFELKAIACDGIEACRMALLKASKKVLPANFIEGMACIGGCIGGAGCLTHGDKNKADVDKYGMEAYEKSIEQAISLVKPKE